MLIIIMGVSGSGKSTIGQLLANRLNLPFADADDHHPNSNIDKMAGGEALTDEERTQWLQKLNNILIEASASDGLVMACSALKEKYRETLQQGIKEHIEWVFLHGENELLAQRIAYRKDHFMPYSLLQSQLDILEKPEYGIHVNVEKSPEEILDTIISKLGI